MCSEGEGAVEQGLFEESVEAITLPAAHLQPDRKAHLLVRRAAAHFSSSSSAEGLCRDLSEAFALSPAEARRRTGQLFPGSSAGSMRAQIRQLAEAGLAGFREAVRARPELRSDEGVAMLEPVVSRLRLLSQLEPAGGAGAREVQVRLAECLVLSGDWRGALAVCQSLSADGRSSYHSTALVFRGFARLLGGEEALALADFQAVLGHPSPHPCSCVRALCGRGLLRMLAGRPYLAALDYATASRLRLDEAALAVQSLVPWNHRGLLAALLLEEGRGMLEQGRGMLEQPGGDQEGERSGKKDSNSTPSTKKGYCIV